MIKKKNKSFKSTIPIKISNLKKTGGYKESFVKLKVPYTKFLIPDYFSKRINRHRLFERLDAAKDKKLIVVSAPAGYGKTSLIGSWLSEKKDNSWFLSWISLDKEDNDIFSFWGSIIISINRTVMRASGRPPLTLEELERNTIEAFLAIVINSIAEIKSPIFVILDDYQLVDNKDINYSLEYFINHMSKNIHLLLLSRGHPSLALSKLQLEDEIELFVWKDLSFNLLETEEFLNSHMGLELCYDEVKCLNSYTEGWIAALKAAAISLKSQNLHKTFAAKFNINNHIAQYLIEEALEGQEGYIQNFLIKTSFLKNLNAEICNAVVGINNAQDILDLLEKNDIFTFYVEETGGYCYHKIFSDILYDMLNKKYSDEVAGLFLAASNWNIDKGLYKEGLEYSIGSMNYTNTIDIIEKYGEKIIKHWNFNGVLEFTDIVPTELIKDNVHEFILCIIALYDSGRLSKKTMYLERLDFNIDNLHAHRGVIAAIRAIMALKDGDYNSMLNFSQIAFDILPKDNFIRNIIHYALGVLHHNLNDIRICCRYFEENMRKVKNAADVSAAGITGYFLSQMHYMSGNLELSLNSLKQIKANNSLESLVRVYLAMAIIYYENDDIESAYENVTKSLDLCKIKKCILYNHFSGMVLLAQILNAQSKPREAVDIIKRIEESCSSDIGILEFYLELPRIVNVMILTDNIDLAEKYVNEYSPKFDGNMNYIGSEAKIQLLIVKGQYEDAKKIIDSISPDWLENAGKRWKIKKMIFNSIALRGIGKNEEAFYCIREALILSRNEKFIHTYIDEGRILYNILLEYIELEEKLSKEPNRELEYAKMLLECYEEKSCCISKQILSSRELEVLQLLADGYTNTAIGQKLFVSLSTVKKHIYNIYSKLNVKNRIQAVKISRELNLIKQNNQL